MSKKEAFRGKKVVIGFDETNNGFDFGYLNPHYKPSLIVTGYLMEDPRRANYGSARFESKRNCGFFKRRKHIPEDLIKQALERGRGYLQANPNFLYVAVPQELKNLVPVHILKAEAIAAMTFKFFIDYNLNPSRTRLLLADMDGEIPSQRVNSVLEMWLEKADIEMSHGSKVNGDSKVVAIRKADFVGYYLAAIHLLGTYRKWPYRTHKVRLDDLIILATAARDRDYTDYPEP